MRSRIVFAAIAGLLVGQMHQSIPVSVTGPVRREPKEPPMPTADDLHAIAEAVEKRRRKAAKRLREQRK